MADTAGMGAALGQAMAAELAAMQNSSDVFQRDNEKAQATQKEMIASLMEGMNRSKGPQISPASMRLAMILDQNDLLRIATERFVQQKLQEVSAAMTTVFGVTPDDLAPNK